MKRGYMVKRKKSKREDFSIKDEYNKCWEYLKSSRNFIYVAILVFFIFVVIGFFFGDVINLAFNSFLGIDLNEHILNFIKDIIERTEGMGHGQLFGFIFFNNLQSSFLAMVCGVVLGILPTIAVVSNGYLLGFVAWVAVKAEGPFILWKIFPHGIFELPAVFISLGLGLKLGMFIFRQKKKDLFKDYVLNSLRIFLLIILPLLIIAAIIEASLIFLMS